MNKKELSNSLMLMQAITLLAIAVFAIISAYSSEFKIVFNVLILVELLLLIINNIFIYKRKYMTILYALAFLSMLVMIFNA